MGDIATTVAGVQSIIGKKVEAEFTPTPEDLMRYSEFTGDWNPLHFDEGLARETIFGVPPLPGLLIYCKIAGSLNEILAPHWFPRSYQGKFRNPAFLGKTLVLHARVPDLPVNRRSPWVACVDVKVKEKKNGRIVLEGRITCYWSKSP